MLKAESSRIKAPGSGYKDQGLRIKGKENRK
jgi:hypothetical protein